MIFFYFPFTSDAPQIRHWYDLTHSFLASSDFPLPQQSQLTHIIQADIAKLLLEHKTRTISQFPDVKGCFKRSFIHTLPPIILALVVLASFLFNSSSFPS